MPCYWVRSKHPWRNSKPLRAPLIFNTNGEFFFFILFFTVNQWLSYLQHFCDTLTNTYENIFNITRDGLRWRDIQKWALTLWNPTNDLGPKKTVRNSEAKQGNKAKYLDSVVVCSRWENVTFDFPIRSNWAVIEPSQIPDFTNASLAASKSFVASAVSTASSPQHTFACLRRFPVEFASPLSRKRRGRFWPCTC